MRARVAVSVLAVMIGACGGTVVESTLPAVSSSTVPAESSSTSTSSAAPATTTTIPGPTLVEAEIVEPLEIPRLENGLPATFVAVTEGWEAVEVDTATGNILRSIARLERPGEAHEEGGVGSAVQQVWRTSDHAWYVVSECCEPAGGNMHYLGPDDVLTRDNQFDVTFSDGWTVAPSPVDGRLVNLGYFIRVGEAGADSDVKLWHHLDVELDHPTGVAAWDPAGFGISWLVRDWDADATILVHLDLRVPEPTTQVLEWVTGDQWLDGMGTQASGNLVAFRHTPDDDPEAPAVSLTEGVVFSPEGELLATFPVETGSFWGGYDPSGRFLIYTDADDFVRWQGLGQSGELAEGFIHASW